MAWTMDRTGRRSDVEDSGGTPLVWLGGYLSGIQATRDVAGNQWFQRLKPKTERRAPGSWKLAWDLLVLWGGDRGVNGVAVLWQPHGVGLGTVPSLLLGGTWCSVG